MANIQNVDYEAIPGKASNMRETGRQLNNELDMIYQKIAGMHNAWYGKRYHSLVVAFNNMIPQLNDLLDLVVGEIPFALETVANNYSRVDQGTDVVGANREAIKKVAELTLPTDVGMKFVTSDVSNVQQEVSTAFEKAKEYMNNFESRFNEVQWQSEAAEKFKSQFITLKNNIVASFEQIKGDFVKLMTEAQNDIQSAESANTVQ